MDIIRATDSIRLKWLKWFTSIATVFVLLIAYIPIGSLLNNLFFSMFGATYIASVLPFIIYLAASTVLVYIVLDSFFGKTRINVQVTVDRNHYCSYSQRIFARILDEVIIIVTTFMISFSIPLALSYVNVSWIFGNTVIIILYIVIGSLYYVSFWVSGQTIGMELAGIIILDGDGKTITWNQAGLRLIFDMLSKLTLGLLYITLFLSPNRQTLADKVSSTYVYIVYQSSEQRGV